MLANHSGHCSRVCVCERERKSESINVCVEKKSLSSSKNKVFVDIFFKIYILCVAFGFSHKTYTYKIQMWYFGKIMYIYDKKANCYSAIFLLRFLLNNIWSLLNLERVFCHTEQHFVNCIHVYKKSNNSKEIWKGSTIMHVW